MAADPAPTAGAQGRAAARAVWAAALAAADPFPLVAGALRLEGTRLRVGAGALDLAPGARVLLLGCGKAGASMARAAEQALGGRLADGFVVVKDGHLGPTTRTALAEAGHPVPDARGEAASARLLALAARAGADDVVLGLISGGGSALTPAPAPPVTLAEKQEVTRLLLAAGATIGELNAVRKHLSRFKGGQLARAAAPAHVRVLVLSDVIGDPLDVIASGPTAPDPTTFADALTVLARRGVADRVAPSVRARLEAGARGEIAETPKPGDPLFARVEHLVVGNNALVVDAAAARAAALGYRVHVWSRAVQGEARDVGRELVARARALEPPACLVAGGETTVTVRGAGKGGRCQEAALAAALELRDGEALTVLAAGTDGTDGPTDAAGALVDRATVAGREDAARAALADNDTYRFLETAGHLVVSGPTHTNLLDLYLVVHDRCPARGRTGASG